MNLKMFFSFPVQMNSELTLSRLVLVAKCISRTFANSEKRRLSFLTQRCYRTINGIIGMYIYSRTYDSRILSPFIHLDLKEQSSFLYFYKQVM